MADYGVTDSGFVTKRLADILDEVNTAAKAALGDDLNTDAQGPFGQLSGVLMAPVAAAWEQMKAAYDAVSPDSATAVSLENVCSINNITRKDAIASTATLRFRGTQDTEIPAGTQVALDTNAAVIFSTSSSVTLSLSDVTGYYADVVATCTVTGPVQAAAGHLTAMVSEVTGVDSVTNDADANVGRIRETDEVLRLRRLTELQRSGTATLEGIRNAVYNIVDVSQTGIIENTADTVDDEGRPPHSFEVFAVGGDEQAIAEAIFNAKPAGIQTTGTITKTVTDSQGYAHTIKFSRPTVLPIYVRVDLTPNTDTTEPPIYPTDGDAQVKAAVAAWGADFTIGQDVITNRIFTPVNTVNGVIGLTIYIGTAAGPTSTANISVGSTQIASFDASRVTVNHV